MNDSENKNGMPRYNGKTFVEDGNGKPLTTGDKPYNDEGTGYFSKGNPGRPLGSRNKYSLAKLKEEGGVGVFRHFVKIAYLNPTVLISLMKKFLPDMQHTEITGLEPIKFKVEVVSGNKKSPSK